MTLLRMPKFNLSPGDAQSLVDYFGGVERRNNPGIGLTFPFEQVAQQDAAAEDYFKQKTAEYVARLKTVKVASSGGKDKTMYDKRIEDLTPVWQAVLKDFEGQKEATKSRVEAATAKMKEAEVKEKEALLKSNANYTAVYEAQLEAARAKAELAQLELDGLTLRAPFAGRITAMPVAADRSLTSSSTSPGFSAKCRG